MTCCPSRKTSADAPPAPEASDQRLDAHAVDLPGGRFAVGTRDISIPEDGEGPPRRVRLKPFALSAIAVTNQDFAQFVAATGYVSEAECFGWSYVFFDHLKAPEAHAPLPGLEWWRKVDGAAWNCPEGPGTNVSDRPDHPVVHVSHRDALAYAAWAGGRLPTEAEWEYAASGGIEGQRFPWGAQEPDDTKFQPCNIWQGQFPDENTGRDGFVGTAPVRSYEPNGFGLYNMCGNTWEWTQDRFRVRSLKKQARAVNTAARAEVRYVVKGGSFLCHASYCYRYRIAARSSNTPDSTTSHTGFRIAFDLPKGA